MFLSFKILFFLWNSLLVYSYNGKSWHQTENDAGMGQEDIFGKLDDQNRLKNDFAQEFEKLYFGRNPGEKPDSNPNIHAPRDTNDQSSHFNYGQRHQDISFGQKHEDFDDIKGQGYEIFDVGQKYESAEDLTPNRKFDYEDLNFQKKDKPNDEHHSFKKKKNKEPDTKTFKKDVPSAENTADSNQGFESSDAIIFPDDPVLSHAKYTGFRGGCSSRPPVPVNALLKCSLYSGCKASCHEGHEFPNGETTIFITCNEGHWKFSEAPWEVVPPCRPKCLPECENNGICIQPNQCQCPKNFAGPQCQYEKKPCLNFPPLPANSIRSCNSRTCTVSCAKGFQFPDGSSVTNLICSDGQWKLTKKEWSTMADCQPVCHPPCLNGGNCLALDVCQCPQKYTGPQCQYEMSACSGEKLGFNGIHNCTGNGEKLVCNIQCPPGISMNITPAEHYTCFYSSGVFEPQPIPSCIYGDNVMVIPFNMSTKTYYASSIVTTGSSGKISTRNNRTVDTEIAGLFDGIVSKPSPGECVTWNGKHFKNFDGSMFSFDTSCTVILVQDKIENLFKILLDKSHCSLKSNEKCAPTIRIIYRSDEYTFTVKDGQPVVYSNGKEFLLPVQIFGLSVSFTSHRGVLIQFTFLDITLKWKIADYLSISVKENMWNRTNGICGTLNNDNMDDFQLTSGTPAHTLEAFISSWTHEGDCNAVTQRPCEPAENRCHVLNDHRFSKCHEVLNVEPFVEACAWDSCGCSNCSCNTIAEFIRQCNLYLTDSNPNWREIVNCPYLCDNDDQIYTSCMPPSVPTCGVDEIINSHLCDEGCVCPEGTVLHKNRCIKQELCPCTLRGKTFASGTKIPKGCNTCTCQNGNWICTEVRCGARCSSVGDPHYITFDGLRFDFMGQCSYHLLKTDSLHVEAENAACSGTLSKSMGFLKSYEADSASCTKTIIVRQNSTQLELRQGGNVLINGRLLVKLPHLEDDISIRAVSSILILVTTQEEVQIWWDGISSVYIDIPATLFDRTKGLCGTFNLNQKDDFLTPEGDIEKSVTSFANKWKSKESCNEEETEEANIFHPCDRNSQIKKKAMEYCGKLKENIFEACHWYVDVTPFYQNCLYDVCSCKSSSNWRSCLCPIFADYASSCAREGIHIPWRADIRECGLHCSGGQTYQACGDSCGRSCQDISLFPNCRKLCVEGCNCPPGQTLNSDNGQCIRIAECPCILHNVEYEPGHQLVMDNYKGPQFCTCKNALWDCRQASVNEIQRYSEIKEIEMRCSRARNEEFTLCEPAEVATCKNMQVPQSSPAKCNPGCVCKKGFVWDSIGKQCVREDACPCHHGGKSYESGQSIQQECNTCLCEGGKWNCTERICPAVCSSWGDTHIETFDGHIYDFQGYCDFLLTGGQLSENETFDVSLEIVPCGASGVSCPKSITLRIGNKHQGEEVKFVKSVPKPILKEGSLVHIHEVGLFVVAEVPHLGITLKWDKGTRVYVTADPRWRSKVKGLCGNMNGDAMDDFKTPSGGINEVSVVYFADSWRLQSHCPESTAFINACEVNPERRDWAHEKCSVLKSSLFKACHSEIPLDPYIERCILDTCACDTGGDCECLCSAIAAYVDACSLQGIPIKWRSQHLCPIQCESDTHYSPCVPSCPQKTCDNSHKFESLTAMCKEQTCIEGCTPRHCEEGFILSNLTRPECIPLNYCKPLCLQIDGKIYFEGDVMEEDACYTCFCSHHKKVCAGLPCATEPTVVATIANDYADTCVSGWTDWINTDHPLAFKKKTDYEALPTENLLLLAGSKARCGTDQIVDIKCREADTHKDHKSSGLDVECSLERGLICYSTTVSCPDYEISVLCDCHNKTTLETTTYNNTTPGSICKEDETWVECALPCNQTCHYFGHLLFARGLCKSQSECLSGCQPEKWNRCPQGFWLRDANTCVTKNDCTCRSHSGLSVKPGVIHHESSCEKCQCTYNNYECDVSNCFDKPTLPPSTTPSTRRDDNLLNVTLPKIVRQDVGNVTVIYLTTPSTVTPPPVCKEDRYFSLLKEKSGISMSASTFLNNETKPENGKLPFSQGSWTANVQDLDQYLQIDLKNDTVIYGVKVAGDPVGHFVTSYRILYSTDGHTFRYISTPENIHHLFRGPIDGKHPVQQIFPVPFEARYVRFNPFTWHGAISLRVDVLGCGQKSTEETTEPSIFLITSPHAIVCEEPLGLENGNLPVDLVVTVSSSKPGHDKFKLVLSSEDSWQPLINSKMEWMMINFGSLRNLTGLIMKGQSHGNLLEFFTPESWIESFNIEYSNDGVHWNAHKKDFLGNFDGETPRKIIFDRPIQAQYLKLIPLKWHNSIALRIEPLGCYEPYSQQKRTTTPALVLTETPPPTCNVCPGVILSDDYNCKCTGENWWDGEECVSHNHCPCVVGHLTYAVGSVYETVHCQRCVCRLHGLSHCEPKKCSECSGGLQSYLSSSCDCLCKSCGNNKILCPTSNICIPQSAWCDGVEDCPDDEVDCRKKEEPKTVCHAVCPPGFSVVYEETLNEIAIFENTTAKCPVYECVPNPTTVVPLNCPEPSCPPKFMVKKEGNEYFESCPKFSCVPKVECSVFGNTFKTFDGTDFKFDICHNILVADLIHHAWNISAVKSCKTIAPCELNLIINVGSVVVSFMDNHKVLYDGFEYDFEQVEIIDRKTKDFNISRLGNTWRFEMIEYGFEGTYTPPDSIEIEVIDKLRNNIGGLCGFYNGIASDDKLKPDGTLSLSTSEFGKSWSVNDSNECVSKLCPFDLQEKALDYCNNLRTGIFKQCADLMNVDQSISNCLESTCTCLMTNKTDDQCRCEAFLHFIKQCKNADMNRDLTGWRIEQSCIDVCPENQIFYDCYPHYCEGTCDNPHCFEKATSCISGCFCANGLLRKGDKCIKPSECRDCICDGLGNSQYLTFDRKHFNFSGNCSYVAVRDVTENNAPNFQVVIKNEPCMKEAICTKQVVCYIRGHSLSLKIEKNNKVKIIADDVEVTSFPFNTSWSYVDYNILQFVEVILPKYFVQISLYPLTHTFTITLPSSVYNNRTEGLCGNCNKNPDDDLPLDLENLHQLWEVDGKIRAPRIATFSKGWKHCTAKELYTVPIEYIYKNTRGKNCGQVTELCHESDEQNKICRKIVDDPLFSKCHHIVDPNPFLSLCFAQLCNNISICDIIDSYAKACRRKNVCIDWRMTDFCPMSCPSGLEYQVCGNSCLKTCDNYLETTNECYFEKMEGCFCRESEVLINGTCQPDFRCKICDEENHRVGDSWHIDNCTKCTCTVNGTHCLSVECATEKTICPDGYHPVKDQASSTDCCPKMICVPDPSEPTIVCHKQKEVECGYGQQQDMRTDSWGCPQYICRCKEAAECEVLQMDEAELPDGMERYVNNTGCCPRIELICHIDKCPVAPTCPPYHQLITDYTGDCCPHYKCELISDVCLLPETSNNTRLVKGVGEEWSQNHCTKCSCLKYEGKKLPEISCIKTKCPLLTEHPDFDEYVIESFENTDECCPRVTRKACKDGKGNEFQLGETWKQNVTDPCKFFKCSINEFGVVSKETNTETCETNCDKGWEYRKDDEEKCCGRCVQTKCIENGTVYNENEEWKSADNCTSLKCIKSYDNLQIVSSSETCPNLDDCLQENVYLDGCCKRCNITIGLAHSNCRLIQINPNETVSLFEEYQTFHGKCVNSSPMLHFTECSGACNSHTQYNKVKWQHESVCQCCQATSYKKIHVPLICEDGYLIEKQVLMPLKCDCSNCGSP